MPRLSSGPLTGRRVLLVEDEALIGFYMAELLVEAEISVIGPISSLAGALRIAGTVEADAALLDVNLGGEFVWPAAEMLATRGVPILFVTGLADIPLPGRLATFDRLIKPIEPRILLARLRQLLSD